MGALNPLLTSLLLRDSLQGRDRDGVFSATATGPVRYDDNGLIVEPGVTNRVQNPVCGVNTTNWLSSAEFDVARVTSLPAPLPDGLSGITTAYRVTANQDITGSLSIQVATIGGTWSSAGAHTNSVYIYVPTAFGGTAIELRSTNFTGSSQTVGTTDLGVRDDWQRVIAGMVLDAGDLTGAVTLRMTSGTMLTGQQLWIVGVQSEPGTVATSLAVGDMGPGYSWAGTPHNSASVRAATVLTFDPDGRVDNDSFAMVGRFSLDHITDNWQAIASAGEQDIGNFFGVFNRDDGRFSAKSNGGWAEDSLTFTPGSPQIAYVAGKDTDWIGQLDDNTPITDTRSDGGAWSNSNVYIGSTNNGDYLNGSVGPIAFYDRPLTDAELDKVKAAISLGRNPWGLLAPKKQYSFFQLRPGV